MRVILSITTHNYLVELTTLCPYHFYNNQGENGEKETSEEGNIKRKKGVVDIHYF